MQNGSDEAPLYIRWNPDKSPYAVELRLDLVAEIAGELAKAERAGIEIGGVLVGSAPDQYSPTLRIEEGEIVPRGMEEGPTYVFDPGQQDRLAEIRSRARARQRDAVGFFRSHLRPGAMRPSLADRSMLAGEFRESPYAFLLIDGRDARTATFFLAANGQLPAEPSVRNFRFDEREFRALPEVQPDGEIAKAQEPRSERKQRTGARAYGTAAALIAVAVAACILMWWFAKESPLPRWAESGNPLKLSVTSSGGLLRVTWDHAAHDLDRASGATVVIVDGPSRRELQLGVDELRLGAVEYERNTSQVQVTMTVNAPGSASPNQTVDWAR